MVAVCFIFLFHFCAVTANADVLTLKNENKIDGVIIASSPLNLIFLSPFSRTPLEVSWHDILILKTDQIYNVKISTGEVISGTINYADKKGFLIQSGVLGKQSISLSQIREISPLQDETSIMQTNSEPINTSTMATERFEDPSQVPQPNEEATYGKDSEEPPVTFLRGSTVLLKPGEMEGRITFAYTPEVKSTSYSFSQQRSFATTLGLNIGIFDNFEAWVDIPFAYVQGRSELAFEGSARQGRDSGFSLKDISIGGNTSIISESDSSPEISLSASLTFPTGRSPYNPENIYYTGNGHWRTTLGIHAMKTVDPAMIYMGASIGYNWPTHENGAKLEYDMDYSYYLGLGMAINDRLTFNTRFQGDYQPALKYDGDKEGRTSLDMMWAAVGFSYRLNSNLVFEPQVAFGLNKEADSSSFILGLSRKF